MTHNAFIGNDLVGEGVFGEVVGANDGGGSEENKGQKSGSRHRWGIRALRACVKRNFCTAGERKREGCVSRCRAVTLFEAPQK
jgi:hypothetical protein